MNAAAILCELMKAMRTEPVCRADIARITGVSERTTIKWTKEMVALGFICRVPGPVINRGRGAPPRVFWQLTKEWGGNA